jgi:hypothetical protein
MAELYFSVNLDNDRTLCIAPLTERRIAMSDQELTDTSGYFLFEQRNSETLDNVEIIAQVISEEAALRLREMLKMT